MLQHHRLCSTAPEATVPLSEWTPIYRLRTNAGKWTYSLQMTRETPPSVQFHHTGQTTYDIPSHVQEDIEVV